MDEKKPNKIVEKLAEHYEKLVLGGSVLIVLLVLVSQLMGKENPKVGGLTQDVNALQAELNQAHPNLQASPVPAYDTQAREAWASDISFFAAPDWAASFLTCLKAKPVEDPAQADQQLKARTKWMLPTVTLKDPEAALDQVKISWSYRPAVESKTVDGTPQRPARVMGFTVERLTPSTNPKVQAKFEPIGKEIKAERVKPDKDKPEVEKFDYEYIDKDIKPKTNYSYRVRCRVEAPETYGMLEANTAQTPPKDTRTLDIWFLTLDYIIPAMENKPMRAKITVEKFDLAKGKRFRRDFSDVRETYRIGGDYTEKEDGSLESKFDFDVVEVVPADAAKDYKPEKAKINFDTKYIVKAIIPEEKVKLTHRKHVHPDPKDKIKFDQKDEVEEEMTIAVIYKDDEGKERKLYRNDPGKVVLDPCSICNPGVVPPPKKEPPKKTSQPPKKETPPPPPPKKK